MPFSTCATMIRPQSSGIRYPVPVRGKRGRGSTKNNEIEDFWFFGTSGIRYPASGIHKKRPAENYRPLIFVIPSVIR